MSHKHIARCGVCGKFISDKACQDRDETNYHFTPDSEHSTEEMYYAHVRCEQHPDEDDTDMKGGW